MNMTLPQIFFNLAEERAERTALRRKEGGRWKDYSWSDLRRESARFGASLLGSGLRKGDRVAIMAPNSPEWVFADLGIMAAGGICVPIYHTEGTDTVRHILDDSGTRILFLHDPKVGRKLLEPAPPESLEKIILLQGSLDHPQVVALEAFLSAGAEEREDRLHRTLAEVSRDETATLVYTSGTTGPPKGVILTHDHILSNLEAISGLFDIGPQDECLSFLPLSHVFERVDGYYFMLHQAVVINYAESPEAVPHNLTEVRPTVVISVPRLYEKMYARVMEKVEQGSWLRKKIFYAALSAGRKHARSRLSGSPPGPALKAAVALARHLVFNKLRERLGGRLRFFISGGAPLRPDICEFFLAAGIDIFEGYGLTESAGGIAVNTPETRRLGTVGRPFPNTEVRIAEDGEILLRGSGIFKGYWNRPEETAQVLSDGWFHTGDVGELDEGGFLSITDRKKDLLITASGENIAPQPLENLFKADDYIVNAVVFGDRRPYLTALLVPELQVLESFARQKGLRFDDPCDLVNLPEVLELIRERIDHLQENLPSFMRVKRFTLLSKDFSASETTPTLKIKRKVVTGHFASVLERMYAAQDHGRHDAAFCVVEELTEEERD